MTHSPIDFMCILTIQLFQETNKLYKNDFNVCQEFTAQMMMRRLFKGSLAANETKTVPNIILVYTYKLKNFIFVNLKILKMKER